MKRIFIVSATLLLSLFAFTHCNHENGEDNGGNNNNPCAVMDADGNCYDTVHIGNQVWMKSNLRTTHFRDGSEIPFANSMNATGSWYYKPANTDFTNYNSEIYGCYYSEKAVHDARGLCPAGWHVPTFSEWDELGKYVSTHYENYFNFVHNYGQDYFEEFEENMEDVFYEWEDEDYTYPYFYFWDDLPIAKAIASKTGWLLYWDDESVVVSDEEVMAPAIHPEYNNSTGFSAYPAGLCIFDNDNNAPYYMYGGRITGLWSSTKLEGDLNECSYFCELFLNLGGIRPYYADNSYGLSVRCVKD